MGRPGVPGGRRRNVPLRGSKWLNQVVPGWDHLIEVFRWERKLLAKFFLSSFGRTVASMAVIYFIQDFLSNLLDKGQGRVAAFVAGVLGTHVTLWLVIGLLLF